MEDIVNEIVHDGDGNAGEMEGRGVKAQNEEDASSNKSTKKLKKTKPLNKNELKPIDEANHLKKKNYMDKT